MQNQHRVAIAASSTLNTNSSNSLALELLRSYHCQAISQAKLLFWFSMVAATVGLVILSYAMIMSSHMYELQLLLRSFSGTVIEIMAGLFFRQAREVRQRATALFDRLRIDKQQTDAITLAESITDAKVQSLVKAYLAIAMVDALSNSPNLKSSPNKPQA
jgi:hypothetical protein